MNSKQVKLYKNKHRNEPENIRYPYVPEHVLRDIEPQQMSAAQVSPKYAMRTKDPALPRQVNQPYAESVPSPLATNASMLNVGNNMEHTWSSGVDEEIVDDLAGDQTLVDNEQPMIDNNEYLTERAFNQPSFGDNNRNRNPFVAPNLIVSDPTPSVQNDLLEVINDLNSEHYLLMVNGEPLCSGPLQEIEEATSDLVLGNSVLFNGQPVPQENIVVLKKIKIKVGVFLG